MRAIYSCRTLPADSTLSDSDIIGAATESANFTPDASGTYAITLTVDDGTDTDSDTTTIEVGADGTVLVLHTDEGSGTTAYDESGNFNDGELLDLEWTGGRFFGGLEFDGSGIRSD